MKLAKVSTYVPCTYLPLRLGSHAEFLRLSMTGGLAQSERAESESLSLRSASSSVLGGWLPTRYVNSNYGCRADEVLQAT